MLVELDKATQIKLLSDAVKKAGSERKLEAIVKIPDSSLHGYKLGENKLTLERFEKILSFLGLDKSGFEFKLIDPKIYRVKGGKAVYKKYLKEKKFEVIHMKMRAASSKRMKRWHAKMKLEDSEKYYLLQYSRFKKIADYKLKTKNGEFVRNKLEQQTADFLFDSGFSYLYEPFVKTKGSVYFPDFKLGNVILECTMWKGFEKAYQLAAKISDLESVGFKVGVLVPDNLRAFYKPIEKHIINMAELSYFLSAQVAQTRVSWQNSFFRGYR